MIDNLGGRLGSFDRLEKELPDGGAVVAVRPRHRRRRCSLRAAAKPPEHRANSGARKERTGSGGGRDAAPPSILLLPHGEGHREAHPSALADLLPDGRASAGHGDWRSAVDVEGYSGMNEDAFARRFYADRAELESLGINLSVDRPQDGLAEQENYSLPPENFYLPAIEFTDYELGRAADGAVAARRRVRLRRAAAPRAPAALLGAAASPLRAPDQRVGRARRSPRRPAATSSPSASSRSRPRSPAARRSPSSTTRWSATRVGQAQGRPLPAALPGRPVLPRRPRARARRRPRLPAVAHPRQGRLRDQGRARLPAAPPTSTRASTPTAPSGSSASRSATAEVWVCDRIAWQVERHFGRYGDVARRRRRRRLFTTDTPTRAARLVGARASARTPACSARRARRRARRAPSSGIVERHAGEPSLAGAARPCARAARRPRRRCAEAEDEPPARGRDPPRALRAPGHAGLAS